MNALDCPPSDLIDRGTWNACDCGLSPHHRCNCPTTPIWAQTIRDLYINPWLAAQFIAIYSRSYSVELQYV